MVLTSHMIFGIPGRFDPDAACCMTELGDIFEELGISHYLQDFLEQGFDSWDTILDITESDFDALNVKLGHRRKLQRKIANSRGLSSDRALASPSRTSPSDDRQLDEQRLGGTKSEAKDGGVGSQGAKRKYRRHPKPDEDAPERPPSAYVIFSNKMREDLKGRNLSFTEIAKLVGENWQNLLPAEKEPYEQQAFAGKERYNNELAEYKKTESFRNYTQYLAEFKARQSNIQNGTDSDIAKRPKLDAHPSTGSTGSSVASHRSADTPTGRMRVESSASIPGQWSSSNGQPSPSTQISSMPTLTLPHGGTKIHHSPNASSPTVLPGYRESIFGASQQALPWREGQRDEIAVPLHQLPRLANSGERRSSYTGTPTADTLSLTGPLQHNHRTGRSQPPPLLTHESTAASGTSSVSTNSSTFFTPRTPMEPPIDRALPIPAPYPQKSPGLYENQLPPLHAPSLSPQSSMLSAQHSPNGIPSFVDFPNSMAPMRGYTTTTPHKGPPSGESGDERLRDYVSANSAEDTNLDPVSALLRAGEIVNRSSRGPPTS